MVIFNHVPGVNICTNTNVVKNDYGHVVNKNNHVLLSEIDNGHVVNKNYHVLWGAFV